MTWLLLALLACKGGGDSSVEDTAAPGEILTRGAPVSVSIPAAGGEITSADGALTLTFPAGALEADTEITITPLGEGVGLWELSPDGLQFPVPVQANVTVTAEQLGIEGDDVSGAGLIPVTFSADGEAERVDALVTRFDQGPGTVSAAFELRHFSVMRTFHAYDFEGPAVPAVAYITSLPAGTDWGPTERTSYSSWRATYKVAQTVFGFVDPLFVQDVVGMTLHYHDDQRLVGGMEINQVTVERVTYTNSSPEQVALLRPHTVELDIVLHVVEDTASVPIAFRCLRGGALENRATLLTQFTFRVGAGAFHVTEEIRRQPNGAWLRVEPDEPQVLGDLDFGLISIAAIHVTCEPGSDLTPGLGLDEPQETALHETAKPADDGACTDHSTGTQCELPRDQERVVVTLDPVLALSQAAATRLFETEFPCGAGPHGTTFCASADPAPSGEWIYLQNELATDFPITDAAGHYQHAFVFDADGLTSNNYEASSSYPKDFFQGTDLWYELLSDPTNGRRVKVTDVRQGFAQVPSHARFVVAGHQLALFVPRSEFDVATPTFRTSAFWHTGDYGLSGGDWSGDYFPLLGDPLLPASELVLTIDE